MASVEPTYYSDLDASLGLSRGLDDLARIDDDSRRYEWSLPDHVVRERDAAVASVKAAIRHLCTDEADDAGVAR